MKPTQVVNKLSFTTNEKQFYNDSEVNAKDHCHGNIRRCMYAGHCPTCGRRMYSFEDNEEGSKAPLGEHAATILPESRKGTPLMYCLTCANDPAMNSVALSLLNYREYKKHRIRKGKV